MFKVIKKIPSYFMFRYMGWPRPLPMNLTFSLSYRCNSRCKTCNVYKKDSYELTPDEWKKVFKSLGKAPFWVTISGGEPFLRDDLLEIVRALYDNCRPAIINIPTNGILHNRIPDRVKEIASYCKGSQIIINLSLDDIEERHDAIRGVPGNFEKALKSFNGLKKIHLDNLALGIHTVISNSMSQEFLRYMIISKIKSGFIHNRDRRRACELGTIGCAITPTLEDYSVAVEFLRSRLKKVLSAVWEAYSIIQVGILFDGSEDHEREKADNPMFQRFCFCSGCA
jgi:sulfatase maturation enzyme AslB (radical SAM superfamily)